MLCSNDNKYIYSLSMHVLFDYILTCGVLRIFQMKFYAANPGAVEENEWGFLVAGFGMGAVVASGFLITLRMVLGPDIPQQKSKGE